MVFGLARKIDHQHECLESDANSVFSGELAKQPGGGEGREKCVTAAAPSTMTTTTPSSPSKARKRASITESAKSMANRLAAGRRKSSAVLGGSPTKASDSIKAAAAAAAASFIEQTESDEEKDNNNDNPPRRRSVLRAPSSDLDDDKPFGDRASRGGRRADCGTADDNHQNKRKTTRPKRRSILRAPSLDMEPTYSSGSDQDDGEDSEQDERVSLSTRSRSSSSSSSSDASSESCSDNLSMSDKSEEVMQFVIPHAASEPLVLPENAVPATESQFEFSAAFTAAFEGGESEESDTEHDGEGELSSCGKQKSTELAKPQVMSKYNADGEIKDRMEEVPAASRDESPSKAVGENGRESLPSRSQHMTPKDCSDVASPCKNEAAVRKKKTPSKSKAKHRGSQANRAKITKANSQALLSPQKTRQVVARAESQAVFGSPRRAAESGLADFSKSSDRASEIDGSASSECLPRSPPKTLRKFRNAKMNGMMAPLCEDREPEDPAPPTEESAESSGLDSSGLEPVDAQASSPSKRKEAHKADPPGAEPLSQSRHSASSSKSSTSRNSKVSSPPKSPKKSSQGRQSLRKQLATTQSQQCVSPQRSTRPSILKADSLAVRASPRRVQKIRPALLKADSLAVQSSPRRTTAEIMERSNRSCDGNLGLSSLLKTLESESTNDTDPKVEACQRSDPKSPRRCQNTKLPILDPIDGLATPNEYSVDLNRSARPVKARRSSIAGPQVDGIRADMLEAAGNKKATRERRASLHVPNEPGKRVGPRQTRRASYHAPAKRRIKLKGPSLNNDTTPSEPHDLVLEDSNDYSESEIHGSFHRVMKILEPTGNDQDPSCGNEGSTGATKNDELTEVTWTRTRTRKTTVDDLKLKLQKDARLRETSEREQTGTENDVSKDRSKAARKLKKMIRR